MLLLVGLMVSGCAAGSSEPAASPDGGLSSTPPPTIEPPSAPPKQPTDVVGAIWETGIVTVGGTGPCYGMTTDGGAELALYSEAGATLVEGDTVRVQVSPASFSADCGPGVLMRLLSIDTSGADG